MVTARARPTTRLLHLRCPRCKVELQVHVSGLAPNVDPLDWLADLPPNAWDYLHEEHLRAASTVVEEP